MHSIERLRWIAGAQWAPAGELAAEAAWALSDLAEEEPAALLPSCRRLLERHPGCGALWWVAASVLAAPDAIVAAQACAQALAEDPTEEVFAASLDAGRRAVRRGSLSDVAGAELVVVEVEALGAAGMVVDPSRLALVEAARTVEVPIWLVAGVGRQLPPRLFDALVRRLPGTDPDGAATTLTGSRYRRSGEPPVPVALDLHGVTDVVGPAGMVPVGEAVAAVGCAEPPELLGGWRSPR